MKEFVGPEQVNSGGAESGAIVTESQLPPLLVRHIQHCYGGDAAQFAACCQSSPDLSLAVRAEDEKQWIEALHRCRHDVLMKLAFRELSGLDDIRTSCRRLSELADVCVQRAVDFYSCRMVRRFGQPLSDTDNEPVGLVVVAMGKLGGEELNFSSDIDLIFAFAHDGFTNAEQKHRRITNAEFFTRLTRAICGALTSTVAHALPLRVDLRLRPFGRAGPVVSSFSALELYCYRHARSWERFALSKARILTGSQDATAYLRQMISSFVYRRHLDFNIIENLRSTKQLIDSAIEKRTSKLWSVKLGAGGIREIEFLLQMQQLIHAGRNPQLRIAGVFNSLPALIGHHLLPSEKAQVLPADYAFLRRLEQRLQYWQGEQTHTLPTSERQQRWLALSMGHANYRDFHSALGVIRLRISQWFRVVFADDRPESIISWTEQPSSEQLRYVVNEKTDCPPDSAWIETVWEFLNRVKVITASRLAHQHINRILSVVMQHEEGRKVAVLKNFLTAMSAIVHRSAYLSMLAESPQSLHLILKSVCRNSWMSKNLGSHPILFDLLLSPESLSIPPRRAQLRSQILPRLAAIKTDDIEQRLMALQEFKRAEIFKTANANVNRLISINRTSSVLSWIADIVVRHALRIALTMMRQSGYSPPEERELGDLPFLIAGYGKLGSGEMGFDSDLDLVLFYNDRTPGYDRSWFVRLARKFIQVMTAVTRSGTLYKVDTRLRPEGSSGTLAISIDHFVRYHESRALVWERQALLKARVVAGGIALAREFLKRRKRLICQGFDEQQAVEIATIRTRMLDNLDKSTNALFDLKQGQWGIVDVEFFCQRLILEHAHQHPGLAHLRSVKEQLKGIASVHPGYATVSDDLVAVHRKLRQLAFACALNNQPALVPYDQCQHIRDAVARLLRALQTPPALPER